MKKLQVILAVLILMVSLGTSNALAAGTAAVTIDATVLGTCAFNSGGAINFGNLDPTSGASPSVTNPAAANFTCTSGTNYTITDDGGLTTTYNLDDGAGSQIPYTLTYTGAGVGSGAAQDLSIQADIAFAAYQTKPAGTYNDTVTLTINP